MLLLAGCGKSTAWLPVSGDLAKQISAPLINAKGENTGEVTFVEDKDGVTITIIAEGLTPGLHGTHIHEKGVCTTPDFTSAGAHFNPSGKQHGFKNPKGFHAGDLPNIEVGEDGKVAVTMTTTDFTLKDSEISLLDSGGSSLVIHEKGDDYKTDPAGDSGARLACAAINK